MIGTRPQGQGKLAEVHPTPQGSSSNTAVLAPQNINTQMAQPRPIGRSDSFELRRPPDEILREMYHAEGGVQSEDQDPPCAVGIMNCCGSCCECMYTENILEGNVGVVTQFGKYVRILPPGAQGYNCCTEKIEHVRIVIQVMHLGSQRVLTKDGLQLSISAFMKYQVIHPQLYKFTHRSPDMLLKNVVSGTLRSIIGQRTLKENLQNQIEIKKTVAGIIKHRMEEHGIIVYDAEIERMAMEVNLQRALAVVAESEREYKSKIIKSKASLESSKIFRMAADELAKNPLSMQLKYFDLLKDITKKKSMMILRDTIVDDLKKSAKKKLAA